MPVLRANQVWSTDITYIRLKHGFAYLVAIISMDGRGRAYDNIFVERLWRSVKHEDVYLNGYPTMGELLIGMTKYFDFYNTERPHQALGNQTPQQVHQSGQGGGAMIVDKHGAKDACPVALGCTGSAFDEEGNEESDEPELEYENRGSIFQLHCKSSAA